ncbi:MAG TPA: sugar ABC transporter permease [Polyangiaceae bacterium]|nr:sugar ABC transporter permease [Polyangiaceae bacterium]
MRPRHRLDPYWMLAPTFGVLVLFFYYPLGRAFLHSLYEWDLLTPPRYVGLENYRVLFTSGALLAVFSTTLAVSVTAVLGSMALGLGLALAVNRPGAFAGFVRTSVFSAYVVSWVSVALLWLWMLDADAGVVSALLRAAGFGRARVLADPSTAPYALAFVIVWKIAGYSMVLFLAGLQSLPPSVLEAAALDGAGKLARFRHVVWPLLAPTTAFVGTTSLILTFQAFDVVRIMTQGGPVRSTTVFVYSIYEQMFMGLRVGRASAEVVVFFAVLLALTALQLWAYRRREAV